jgi:quaternary ammonium compound-resistance protein SugE
MEPRIRKLRRAGLHIGSPVPVGTAYSVWVGVGAIGTVILGILLLGESASAARMISLALILAGIIGLKLSTT